MTVNVDTAELISSDEVLAMADEAHLIQEAQGCLYHTPQYNFLHNWTYPSPHHLCQNQLSSQLHTGFLYLPYSRNYNKQVGTVF